MRDSNWSTAWAMLFAIFCLGGAVCAAQQPPEPPAMTVQRVRGEIFAVKGGSGANTGFAICDQGVIAIDAKMTEDSTKRLVAEVARLTPKPILSILLTHSDGDHVNGLTGFPAGLPILAHENTKKDMEAAFKDVALQALRAYLPNRTIARTLSLQCGPTGLDLLHFGPAHTSGDILVLFPGARVAFVGDLVFIGRDPLIHRHKGGTSFGLVRALKEVLKLDADTFVPGHGDLFGKTDIQALIASFEDKQARIQAMVQEGKTLEEVKKAFGIDDRPGQLGRRWPSPVEIIYLDITEKKS
jgi:cyclase